MDNLSLKVDSGKQISKPIEVNSRYDNAQKEKIAKATKQFEGLLTSMMLKSMNQSSGSMMGDEGYGNDVFNTVFEQQIGTYISDTKSLGVAEVLYKKITGEDMTPEMRYRISDSMNKISIKNTSVPTDATSVHPSEESLNRLQKLDKTINDASKKYGVDKNMIKSIIMTESAGKVKAVSSAKAKGLMQLMDSTAQDLGVKNVYNPTENINGGTKYFAQMLRQYDGDVKMALAAYNAGPQNVDKYNGIPPFDETKNYINKVLSYLNHFNESAL
jgi:Rod binding domain-containing protein